MIKRILLGGLALFFAHNQLVMAQNNLDLPPAGHLFNTTINPDLNFTLNTTTPAKLYQSAGIKSLNPNVSLLNLGAPSANGYHIFSVSDATAIPFSFSAPAGNANFKACLNAKNKTYSCEHVNINVQYAYVPDNNGFVWQCPLSQDGSFGTCTKTPIPNTTWRGPFKITFATVHATQYAYVADGDGSGNVYQCLLNSSNDTFTSCAVIPNQGWQAEQVAFAIVNGTKYAYVAALNGAIWRCPLTNGGLFGTCASLSPVFTPDNQWLNPAGVTFAIIGGTKYAYVSDVGTDNVYRCTLNTDGSFNTCSFTNQNGWHPYETVFATVGSTQYAYVADDSHGGNVWQCPLNKTNGTFGVCLTNSQSYSGPLGLAFSTIAGIQYAYVADGPGTGNAYQCTLNPDGSFNICLPTPNANPGWLPNGVTILSR